MAATAVELTVQGQTVQGLLKATREEIAAHLTPDVLAKAATEQKKAFAGWVTGASWQSLRLQVADHVCDALKENLVSIFAGAWARYYELRKCAKETRDDPKSSGSVTLLDHEFTYELDFGLDLLMDEVKMASIPFAFALSCNVSGLELWLKNGCVTEVRSGTLDCTAEIRCADQTVWNKQLADIHLPGELRMSHPVEILG